jgi:hypothetical protein
MREEREQEQVNVDVIGRFEPRELTDEQAYRCAEMRERFQTIARGVLELVPPGREQSIVLTHLEEAGFMAIAGIARGESRD